MLSKEECEKALEHLKEWVCADNVDDMVTFRGLIDEHFEIVEEHEKYKKALHNAIKECCFNVSGSDACNSLDELYKAFERKVWESVEQRRIC